MEQFSYVRLSVIVRDLQNASAMLVSKLGKKIEDESRQESNGPRINPHRQREIRSYKGYNFFMRAIVAPEAGSYSYAGTGYANPHAVTQIAFAMT
jgi:hypothetical protein